MTYPIIRECWECNYALLACKYWERNNKTEHSVSSNFSINSNNHPYVLESITLNSRSPRIGNAYTFWRNYFDYSYLIDNLLIISLFFFHYSKRHSPVVLISRLRLVQTSSWKLGSSNIFPPSMRKSILHRLKPNISKPPLGVKVISYPTSKFHSACCFFSS